MSPEERSQFLQDMTDADRTVFAALVKAFHPDVFDDVAGRVREIREQPESGDPR